MREIITGKDVKPGTRLDAYVMSVFPALTKNALYMAFRKKDVKIGGKWAAPGAALSPQDKISVYLPDQVLFGEQRGVGILPGMGVASAGFSVAYEDDRLLIVNKASGVPVHPDRNGSGVTLIELASEYFNGHGGRGECGGHSGHGGHGGRGASGGGELSLCHRIDRNTSGLVLIAKDKATLGAMLQKLSGGEIKKDYRCVVNGRPEPPEATIRAYMAKDPSKRAVRVFQAHERIPAGAKEIITKYRTVYYDAASGTSKLEVSLLTGRTHQIRAHLASIGHPVIGDGKYCPNAINKTFHARFQMLTAFRLTFPDMPGFGVSGRTIEIPDGLVPLEISKTK